MNKEQAVYELVNNKMAGEYIAPSGIDWQIVDKEEYNAEVERLSNWEPTLPDWSIAPDDAAWASYDIVRNEWWFTEESVFPNDSDMKVEGWIKRPENKEVDKVGKVDWSKAPEWADKFGVVSGYEEYNGYLVWYSDTRYQHEESSYLHGFTTGELSLEFITLIESKPSPKFQVGDVVVGNHSGLEYKVEVNKPDAQGSIVVSSSGKSYILESEKNLTKKQTEVVSFRGVFPKASFDLDDGYIKAVIKWCQSLDTSSAPKEAS